MGKVGIPLGSIPHNNRSTLKETCTTSISAKPRTPHSTVGCLAIQHLGLEVVASWYGNFFGVILAGQQPINPRPHDPIEQAYGHICFVNNKLKITLRPFVDAFILLKSKPFTSRTSAIVQCRSCQHRLWLVILIRRLRFEVVVERYATTWSHRSSSSNNNHVDIYN